MAFSPDSGIRRQDAYTAFASVARNDIGRDYAWDYLKENWVYISN